MVDIILPVYNGEEYLSEALDSVLAQTYTEWVCYIVDDGSTDKTIDIINKYCESDKRFTFIQNETNQGISYSLNRGIAQGNSKYIARLDADDKWYPYHLSETISFLEHNPNIELVGTYVTIDGRVINTHTYRNPTEIWQQLSNTNPFNHPTVVFRRTLFEQSSGYQSKCDGFEDWHLWARLVTPTNATVLEITSVYYRVEEGKTLTIKNPEEYIRFKRRLVKRITQ